MISKRVVVDIGSQSMSDENKFNIKTDNSQISDADDNDDIKNSSYALMAAKDSNKWNLVKISQSSKIGHCNKKKHEPVNGSRDMSEMLSNLHVVEEVHTWHCKVSRINEDINEVRGYLGESGVVISIKVKFLHRHDDAPLSMHLTIPYNAR